MIRNKVFGSSAPRVVFVFWGSGAPYLLKSPGVVGGHAPTVGGRSRRWLTGFPLDPVRPSPRPHVLGLAWATGPARPQPPWRLSSGSAPR